ncbi:MAG TPA: response regulator [Bryobacteraceae bacterium]|jgi:two-component system NtrC family sensor kinase|nr:response regulator [Bryobacteraceae bacterium]
MSTNGNGHKPTVLIADDEEMVITSIRAFLQLESDFDIHGFTDPEEAARFAAENPIDVAVSDYLMPKMNGIQLLAKIKEAQPEASRVLLTGHADKQSAIQAINQVALFQYLEKPWENSQLLLVIKSGAERAQLFRDLREKVEELDTAHSSLKGVQRRLIEAFL